MFHDCLISIEDKEYFKQMVAQLVKKWYGAPSYRSSSSGEIIFGDFSPEEEAAEDRVAQRLRFRKDGEIDGDDGGVFLLHHTEPRLLQGRGGHATRIAHPPPPRGNAMLVALVLGSKA